MPKLSSFSGLSSRGFGEFGTTLTLTTVTFTSSTSWTAPPGVTNLITASGRGSNGQSDYYQSSNVSGVIVQPLMVSAVLGPLDWSTPYSDCQTMVNDVNAGGTGPRVVTPGFTTYYYISSSNLYVRALVSNPSYQVNGPAVLINQNGSPTSGTVTYAAVSANQGVFLCNVDVLYPGPAGTASTGFGETFPGGSSSGGTAPITVFNNVSVSPGTSYSIVIPTDNVSPYITIQYLAPT
jgi:hypothetical protein